MLLLEEQKNVRTHPVEPGLEVVQQLINLRLVNSCGFVTCAISSSFNANLAVPTPSRGDLGRPNPSPTLDVDRGGELLPKRLAAPPALRGGEWGTDALRGLIANVFVLGNVGSDEKGWEEGEDCCDRGEETFNGLCDMVGFVERRVGLPDCRTLRAGTNRDEVGSPTRAFPSVRLGTIKQRGPLGERN
ncbi:BQ5605_C009g05684 [Microbotryum silenes-dioicae]|uniref:BQ5605_C009g05684 protein n=1 Tax=Microbotryum silenes-dioicae TaxID=796604 RepID=A0A2X0ME50_9BASI|nr:BQ5605_C009g05684 [Microbotryum silenes-dioicae]